MGASTVPSGRHSWGPTACSGPRWTCEESRAPRERWRDKGQWPEAPSIDKGHQGGGDLSGSRKRLLRQGW